MIATRSPGPIPLLRRNPAVRSTCASKPLKSSAGLPAAAIAGAEGSPARRMSNTVSFIMRHLWRVRVADAGYRRSRWDSSIKFRRSGRYAEGQEAGVPEDRRSGVGSAMRWGRDGLTGGGASTAGIAGRRLSHRWGRSGVSTADTAGRRLCGEDVTKIPGAQSPRFRRGRPQPGADSMLASIRCESGSCGSSRTSPWCRWLTAAIGRRFRAIRCRREI